MSVKASALRLTVVNAVNGSAYGPFSNVHSDILLPSHTEVHH